MRIISKTQTKISLILVHIIIQVIGTEFIRDEKSSEIYRYHKQE